MNDSTNILAPRSANAYLESQGMRWLVLGFAPGFEFLSAHDTRAEANAWLKDEYDGKTFDYYAVVKARDHFMAP